jgi:hypothetical protein
MSFVGENLMNNTDPKSIKQLKKAIANYKKKLIAHVKKHENI